MGIRDGNYRVIEVDDDAALIVEAHGPFTQLTRVFQLKCLHSGSMNTGNCAVMLAQCLNSGLDTMGLYDLLTADGSTSE